MRHPVKASIDKFSQLLDLQLAPGMQDWEVQCADPARTIEFLACYDQHAQSDDDKFTLMALILGSFEAYHDTIPPSETDWAAIRQRLISDIEIHRDHITYYGCPETDDPAEWLFPITPLIRTLLDA